MMAAPEIVAPENSDAKVVALPDGQFPYGLTCVLDRKVQSVLFHYGVDQDVVDILVEERLTNLKRIREADPDGDDDAKEAFQEAVNARVPAKIMRIITRKAFRRLLRPDPFAEIVPPPPPPKPVTAASSASSSSSSASSSSITAAPPAKKVKTSPPPDQAAASPLLHRYRPLLHRYINEMVQSITSVYTVVQLSTC